MHNINNIYKWLQNKYKTSQGVYKYYCKFPNCIKTRMLYPKQNKNYIVSKVGELIQSMIQDIVNAKGQSEEVSVNLMQSISNRSDFIKGLTALDF